MADPISLLASVMTIAAAAAQIGKAISRLRAFGEVSNQVFALKNEVTDLELVLNQLGGALRQNTLPEEYMQGALEQLLKRTESYLFDLARAIEKFADTCAGNGANAFDKGRLRYKSKGLFQDYQEKLRVVKDTLNVGLSASNSRDLHHIKLELRRISLLTAISREKDQATTEAITDVFKDHQITISTKIDQRFIDMSDRIESLSRLLLTERSGNSETFDRPPAYSVKPQDQPTGLDTIQVLLSTRATCRGWCPCACHAKRTVKAHAPRIVESLVGKMFVGYSGLPVFSNPCDFRGCKDRQLPGATVEYWFPPWFIAMNLKLQLKVVPQAGPQFQLSTTRRVPDSSQSITFAMQGDIEGLKYLFSAGLAAPRDVSNSRGYSLMRWALYGGMHNFQTVHFLMSQGANVDEISYNNVWDFLMRGKCNETEAQALRCISEGGEGDWLEDQNFPLVHRIIFGLSDKPLSSELLENPNAVYVTDAQGRTALDWATARTQLNNMSLLIQHGANTNNMDITGRTPVLHAVDSHDAACLRLILTGGGNPNLKMPKGLFRSSPLTAAGFSGMTSLLKLLLEFGAEPNACNPEGLTALHSVARTQNVDCALLLLEHGADLNFVSTNGATPLTTAIAHNNHPVLKLFVDRCYDYITSLRFGGPPLLPVISESADSDTISVLASSHPLKLALDLTSDSLARARALLEQRLDYNETLSVAFEELVTIAKAEESMASSIDSLQEAGLFYSARSSFHRDLAEVIEHLDSLDISSATDPTLDDEPVAVTDPVDGSTERVQWS